LIARSRLIAPISVRLCGKLIRSSLPGSSRAGHHALIVSSKICWLVFAHAIPRSESTRSCHHSARPTCPFSRDCGLRSPSAFKETSCSCTLATGSGLSTSRRPSPSLSRTSRHGCWGSFQASAGSSSRTSVITGCQLDLSAATNPADGGDARDGARCVPCYRFGAMYECCRTSDRRCYPGGRRSVRPGQTFGDLQLPSLRSFLL